MNSANNKAQDFIYIASKLCEQFPELDLRFSMQTGQSSFNLSLPELNNTNYEISLSETLDSAIREATFLIKQIARHYDA